MTAAHTTRLTAAQVEQIARALSDPNRFSMLQQIARAEESLACGALREQQALSPATVSHHMKELQDAGLIDVARNGRCANLSFRRDVWNAYVKQLSAL